MPNSAIVFQVI